MESVEKMSEETILVMEWRGLAMIPEKHGHQHQDISKKILSV